MAKPSLQPVAQLLYELVEPIQYAEQLYDYPMAKMIQAMTLGDEEVWYFADDITALVDIDRTPDKALPWLGQFFGVRPRLDLESPEQRDRIRNTDGWLRGTEPAIIAAAKQYLTGQKRVSAHWRDTSAYHFTIITYDHETPDQDAVLSALQEQKPDGLRMTYTVAMGQTFRDLRDGNATFRIARTKYATFREMRDNEPGV